MIRALNFLLYTVFVSLLLGIAGLLIGSMLPIPGNIELKIVKSGSMEPTIPTGSLVIVKPANRYSIGDVITFGADTKTEIPTTHRIISFTGANGETQYKTKGDANEEADTNPVARRDVIGKIVFHIPYVGFILDFARQPLGFALLIGIPAALVILEEVITISREVRLALRRRREGKRGEGDSGGENSAHEETRLVYLRRRAMDEIFVPMLAGPSIIRTTLQRHEPVHADAYGMSTTLVLGLVFMSSLMSGGAGGTIAYFNDIERSLGNIFRAGEWGSEVVGDPQSIVLNEFLPNPNGIAYGFDFGNDASDMPQGEWVELFNNGAVPLDLTGWYLADESGGAGNTQAIITAANTQPATTVIPAGGWLVVYFNKPVLNDTGDSIFLYTAGGVLVDSYTYDDPSDFCNLEPTPTDPNSTTTPTGTPGNGPNADCPQAQVAPNKSYARIPDGIGAFVDPIPTPGAENIPEPELPPAMPSSSGGGNETEEVAPTEETEEPSGEAPADDQESAPVEGPVQEGGETPDEPTGGETAAETDPAGAPETAPEETPETPEPTPEPNPAPEPTPEPAPEPEAPAPENTPSE